MNNLIKEYLPECPKNRESWGIVLLPIFIAIILLVLDRWGLQISFYRLFSLELSDQGYDSNQIKFYAQVYFSVACFILFVVLPIGYHILFPIDLSNPFGLSLAQVRNHWMIYFLLLAVMLPVLWFASLDQSFYDFYPMYKPISLQWLIYYEIVYLLQFVFVEFFFRGFALFRLEKHYGFHAVTLMTLPYALIHIHKPFPEALGSIIAGLILGWLALKSRSIWPGVMVHAGVALSMDMFALHNSGRLVGLF